MSPAKSTVFCFIRLANAKKLQDIMKSFNWRRMADLIAVIFMVLSAPTTAQGQEQSQQQLGEVAASAAGKVGQRKQPQENIEPMARINNRVSNRIQNRIRNRIDRYYNPQTNVTSPFDIAAEQARKAGAPTPR